MTQLPKIVHLSLHNPWRGGEQQAVYLYQALKNEVEEQTILCLENSDMAKYCADHQIPYKPIASVSIPQILKVKRFIEKAPFDLIHIHDSKAHTFFALMAVAGLKVKAIVHRRVDFPVKHNFLSKRKYNLPQIVAYICVSDAVKQILLPSLKTNVDVFVLHDIIDMQRFKNEASKQYLRTKYTIPVSNKIIGNIAALADHKDYFTFVDTAEIVLQKNIPATFIIIGQGPLESEIRNYIAKKKLADKIIMTGFLPDITQILPEFDIFLMTSKTEGLGSGILDAMCCRVPVIATKAGGIPEIIYDGENGLLADVGNPKELAKQIEFLLFNPKIYEKLVVNANKFVTNFTPEKMAQKITAIYRKIYSSGT